MQYIAQTDSEGTLEKPSILPAEASAQAGGTFGIQGTTITPTLLDGTLGEVLHDPFNVNQTRITKLWKCGKKQLCLLLHDLHLD